MVFGVRQAICECNTSSRRLMRSKKYLKDLCVVCFFSTNFFSQIYIYIWNLALCHTVNTVRRETEFQGSQWPSEYHPVPLPRLEAARKQHGTRSGIEIFLSSARQQVSDWVGNSLSKYIQRFFFFPKISCNWSSPKTALYS